MVDRPVAQIQTCGEAGVSRADDYRGNALDGSDSLQLTSTVTFVGFVSASNTADRFWD